MAYLLQQSQRPPDSVLFLTVRKDVLEDSLIRLFEEPLEHRGDEAAGVIDGENEIPDQTVGAFAMVFEILQTEAPGRPFSVASGEIIETLVEFLAADALIDRRRNGC